MHERGRDGFFRCPNKCGNPDYPQPKWKTEAGFEGHLAKCKAKPEDAGVWNPPPRPTPERFAECEDCGIIIWKMSSCWHMPDRIVCMGCCQPYYEAGVGFHDCAGLVMPGLTLEG